MSDTWEVAVHEAAHAVVADHLGADVSRVAAVATEDDLGCCEFYGDLSEVEDAMVSIAPVVLDLIANDFDISNREDGDLALYMDDMKPVSEDVMREAHDRLVDLLPLLLPRIAHVAKALEACEWELEASLLRLVLDESKELSSL